MTGAMTIIESMTREQAEACRMEINAAAVSIGRNLLKLKESGGWAQLLDEEGNPYKTWTDCLSRGFSFSRQHLYEFMRAAPVTERLQAAGKTINTDQALALNRYEPELQMIILETAEQRGGVTADRIHAIGEVLTEMKATGGYVTTHDGAQTAIQNAISAQRREQEIIRQENRKILSADAQVKKVWGDSEFHYITLAIPKNLMPNIDVKQSLYVHIVVRSQIETALEQSQIRSKSRADQQPGGFTPGGFIS